MSRAEQLQAAPRPPAPRTGYLCYRRPGLRADRHGGDPTEEIGATWARSGAAVRNFTFPTDLNLNHDLIDSNNPSQRVELVYPTLINLIEETR